MRIAVIGTGNVGSVLGSGWAAAGHQVTFGSRSPHSDRSRELAERTGAAAASPAAAVDTAEVVVLATPWQATRDTVLSLGALAGKIVVDCTNPLRPDLSGLATGDGPSGGEQVAAWAEGARVVKAFNTTGSDNMADPDYAGQPLAMFIAGDDDEAKQRVGELAGELGFDAVDAGPLANSGLLESLAMLWIRMAYELGMGSRFGLALLRRGS